MNYPVLIHCESGRKALLERAETQPGRYVYPLSYWTRWSTIWVEVNSPLLAYKQDGTPL